MIKVLLVDDQPEFCELLSAILERSEFTVVGVAHDGAEAVRQAQALKPNVVVMDIQMPVMSGVEATVSIAAALPNTKVLLVSAYSDQMYGAVALKAGAVAFVTKRDFSLQRLRSILAACLPA